MSNIQRSYFQLENFFLDVQRQRPVFAVALTGMENRVFPSETSPSLINTPKNGVSIATIGQRPDSRETDAFLHQFDNGHLLGEQYGGGKQSYNLVPMLRKKNRGGEWSRFETLVKKTREPSLVFVRCRYPNYKMSDPRIPRTIEGFVMPIKLPADQNFQGKLWIEIIRVIEQIHADKPIDMLATFLYDEIGSKESRANRQSVYFNQEPFNFVAPTLNLADPNGFRVNLLCACKEVVANDWLFESQNTKNQIYDSVPSQLRSEFSLNATYILPPAEFRPYAALDLMNIKGQLKGVFADQEHNKKQIAENLMAKKFSSEMRDLAKHANLILSEPFLNGQIAYLSDARRFEKSMDLGTEGQGIVLDPDADHILPHNGLPKFTGPTIFSNLQLVSSRYNAQKNNRILFELDKIKKVGFLVKIRGKSINDKRPYKNYDDDEIKDPFTKKVKLD